MIAGSIPKKGRDALPGLVGVTPPRGVMTWDPVSVCQYVCDIVRKPFIRADVIQTYIYNVGLLSADNLVVPLPDLCGDWLTNTTEHPQVLHLVLNVVVTRTLEQSQSCRRNVEL